MKSGWRQPRNDLYLDNFISSACSSYVTVKLGVIVMEIQQLTYEQYLMFPETIQRYEIIDGDMTMPPAPSFEHQWITDSLVLKLRPFVQQHQLGVVVSAPVDVLIQREPLRTRQPDVLFLSSVRTGIRGREGLRELQILNIAPDLVIEVLSPSETRRDVADKLADYRGIGVQECWLVSPEAQSVEVLHLNKETEHRVGLFGIGDTVQSEVLPELQLTVEEIFA
jgi:Uma2 family endonuclease